MPEMIQRGARIPGEILPAPSGQFFQLKQAGRRRAPCTQQFKPGKAGKLFMPAGEQTVRQKGDARGPEEFTAGRGFRIPRAAPAAHAGGRGAQNEMAGREGRGFPCIDRPHGQIERERAAPRADMHV